MQWKLIKVNNEEKPDVSTHKKTKRESSPEKVELFFTHVFFQPLVSFPGQNIVCVSFLLSLIFQEAFLWLERVKILEFLRILKIFEIYDNWFFYCQDSKRTAIYATLSFIASIFVMSLVWFYQEQHGRAYTGGGKIFGEFVYLFFY